MRKLVFLLLLCSGCSMIDEVAEGWMVLRHYQEIREREKERKADLCQK